MLILFRGFINNWDIDQFYQRLMASALNWSLKVLLYITK